MPEKQRRYGLLRMLGLILSLTLLAAVSAFGAGAGQAAMHADKPEAMFPHMDAAMGYLQAADKQLKEGEPIFYGHRIAAMKHTEAAIADLQAGIDGYMKAHPSTQRNETIPEPPPAEAGDKAPHMQGALKLLQQAQAELEQAKRIFNGRRVEGLDETKAAVNEIQIGMKSAAAHKNE